ncbi:MAG: LppX_LprAFG lipoprotein [Actinomycetota bacterium]
MQTSPAQPASHQHPDAPDDSIDAGTLRGRWRHLGTAVSALVGAAVLAACGGGSADGIGTVAEPTGDPLPADAATILAASAETMGDTTSVEFRLERSGAPVFIDEFDAIALNRANGQFEVPRTAQAVLEVEVDGSLTTELAAIALDDDIWLSNPVTGDFEPLPPGIELDPSMFFDPENGWRPLMAGLTDVELHGLVERDGADRYHLSATAPAEQVEIITARLVRDLSVEIDVWLQPVNGAVMAAEFSTALDEGDVDWTLTLSNYGADFVIEPPAEVLDATDGVAETEASS